MRDLSVPAWTVLRGHSSSSPAPSEDELQSRASQDMVDEIAPSPPAQLGPPLRPKQSATGPGASRVADNGARVGDSGVGKQHLGAASRMPPPSSFTRRPLPDSDEEEEVRPKKKKRRLIDPTKGSAAGGVRVSLDGLPNGTARPSQSSKAAPSTASPARPFWQARNGRGVTFGSGALASRDTTSRPTAAEADRRLSAPEPSSSTRPPLSQPRKASALSVIAPPLPRTNTQTPLQRAKERRKSTNLTSGRAGPSEAEGSQAGPSSQRPPQPSAPAPQEVIEILDSDDEPPPPRPNVPAKAPAPPQTQAKKTGLPRRTKYKAAPPPKYKEDDDGVIHLTSDDDTETVSAPQRPQECPLHSERRDEPPRPPARPASKAPTPPDAGHDGGLPDDDMPVDDPAPLDESIAVEPTAPAPEVEDIPMADEDPPADIDEGPPAAEELPQEYDPISLEPPHSDQDPPDAEAMLRDSPPDVHPETQCGRAQSETARLSPPAGVPAAGEAAPTHDASHTLDETTARDEAAARPPPEESSPRAESSTIGSGTPLERDLTPGEVPARVSPTPEESSAQRSQLPPVLAPSALPPITRSETASPVSSFLSGPLQDLEIASASSSSNPSGQHSPLSQPTNAWPDLTRSTSRAPSPQSRASTPKIRVRRALYSGPEGFFKHVYSARKKRDALQTASQPTTPSPSTPSLPTTRAAVSLSPTATRIGRSGTLPSSSQGSSRDSAQPPIQPYAGSGDDPVEAELDPSAETLVSSMAALSPVSPVLATVQTSSDVKASSVTGEGALLQAHVTESTEAVPETTSRHDTPVEDPPAPRTLSQIIRMAVNENARNNVIDLTRDDSDNERASSKPSVPSHAEGHPAPATTRPSSSTGGPAAPALSPASEPIKMVDLSAIRNIRKKARTSHPLSPSKPPSATPPIPRNLRRTSGPSTLCDTIPGPKAVPSPAQMGAGASTSQSDTPPSTDASTPLISASQIPPLSRLPDLTQAALLAASPVTAVPALEKRASPVPQVEAPSPSIPLPPRVPSPPRSAEEYSPIQSSQGALEAESARLADVIEPAQHTPSPSRSQAPERMEEMEEEEECLSLIYPDSAEATPEVQMGSEHGSGHQEEHEREHVPEQVHLQAQVQTRVQEEGAIVPYGPRTRSQAASEASSASGPRRSARLTSTSASSSVEPPERPGPATRRRRLEPSIRTSSDEDVVSQGGISRRDSYSKAFEAAGFEAISWKKDRKRLAAEFAPLTQLAKDIPHDLQDRLNALSLSARLAGNMQVLVFEAEIRANTAEDEPYAPPIQIVNEVDDEPTPPLEFYYSNLMWHGEGVPWPDHENLQGCDCVGPCNPLSKTCACIKRQRKYWTEGGSLGFIYDRKGRLRKHEYPIFECNMNCGCSDDCMNRVVQHGRQHEIAICKTEHKGWGVFAGTKRIPANSFIGVYAGEYLTDHETEIRGTIYNKVGRTYLFDLDFWFLKLEGDEDEKNKYCIDAYHAGNFTRYLNHSCDPNCVINACYINEANLEKPLLTIFTCRDIEPYEELCFSYFGQPDDEEDAEKPPAKEKDREKDKDKDKDKDAVYMPCRCGAPNCTGKMWR